MTTSGVVRVRFVLSYDGKDFAGWATQPDQRTVQGCVEGALTRLLGSSEPARLVVAGRTDAGVHARAQVAHCDIAAQTWERLDEKNSGRSASVLTRKLNSLLPDDIAIHHTDIAPPGFDARFSAQARHYRYRVHDRIYARDPLVRGHVMFHDRPLDVDTLNDASARLLGLRDFAAFCKPRHGATTIRTLMDFTWTRDTHTGILDAHVVADAFCHSMVRSLVGAVLAVGDGRRDLAWLTEVLSQNSRSSEVRVAPAHGLVLEVVDYPVDDQLSARASATRAKRTLN